jgi:hypothetical protein
MQTYNGSGTNNLSGKLRMIGFGSASHAPVARHKRSCEEMCNADTNCDRSDGDA